MILVTQKLLNFQRNTLWKLKEELTTKKLDQIYLPLTVHWQYGGATQEQSAANRYSASVSADE